MVVITALGYRISDDPDGTRFVPGCCWVDANFICGGTVAATCLIDINANGASERSKYCLLLTIIHSCHLEPDASSRSIV